VPAELTLKSWKRYGHDRTYVQTEDGASLGYRDNKTDEIVVYDEERRMDVLVALGVIPAPAVPDLEPYAITIDRLATDLSGNKAGGSARERAREERAAAPVASLLARLMKVHTDERAWRVGAEGEERVGGQLEKLRKEGVDRPARHPRG
jgi:hypothetical protein